MIKSVDMCGPAADRMKSLGMVKGAKVYVAAFSLFNGGMLILCGYSRIALRLSVARKVDVEVCR